ncbi:Serine acetyltransferase [Salmonella enterica subsp. enterica serovar Heidelberg str. 85-0486]|nr:Serine acetyltransferase [Salmonella enterica subsp. enterica serovar Heidelberg str. 85-0486]
MRLFAGMNFHYVDYLCRPITIAVVTFYFGGVWQMRCISMVQKTEKTGLWINRKLNSKFGIDIELGAVIGYGLDIPHHMGIVITKKARIGCNLSLKQNTTVGNKQGLKEDDFIIIGNNVDIGANTCIIGSITIGDNVTIGAMSFVNKSIPANSIYITKKTSEVIPLINHKKWD